MFRKSEVSQFQHLFQAFEQHFRTAQKSCFLIRVFKKTDSDSVDYILTHVFQNRIIYIIRYHWKPPPKNKTLFLSKDNMSLLYQNDTFEDKLYC